MLLLNISVDIDIFVVQKMEIKIIKITHNYKKILKYVICGQIKTNEKLCIEYDGQTSDIGLTYQFEYNNGKRTKGYINLKYEKLFNNISDAIQQKINEYIQKQYNNIIDFSSNIDNIDDADDIVILDYTTNYATQTSNKPDASCVNSDETLTVKYKNKIRIVKFKYKAYYTYSDGYLDPVTYSIKSDFKIDPDNIDIFSNYFYDKRDKNGSRIRYFAGDI